MLMPRMISFAALFLCCIGFAQDKPNVNFEWSFSVLSSDGKERVLVPLLGDTTLKSGDEIKMMVKLKRECFVYVIHEDAAGEIFLRFPYDLKQFTSDYKVGKNYYLPKGRDWFKLDNKTGRETFHLLGSSQRLLDLEVLFGKYRDADASKKPAVAKEIVSEIRNVRRHYKTFTTLAERPISIGGNVRGLGKEPGRGYPDVSLIAIEISAMNLFGKTFTIDHQ
ncbi:DUF4384 domain-containing protein [bacterium]|nr:MAG: DUF4384 domain-containing protein [bacterium]